MGWIKNLFKRSRQDRFIQLLTQQADFAVEGADALLEYLKHPSEEQADQVTRIEKEADEVRRILIADLNNTFITPLDREDIYALSRDIDDVLDYARSTVEEMFILGVQSNAYLHRMVSMLGDAAREILLGVQRLQDHPEVADNHAVRAKALHNRMEKVYREALAELFHRPEDIEHIMQMLKLRETYRHLSNAGDRWDEAANVLSDIVVKMP